MTTIGFTGSRHGITPVQDAALWDQLTKHHTAGAAFHHGDCVGADIAAAKIARQIGYHVIAHPPTNRAMRAHHRSDEIRPELPYLDRNRAIIDASTIVVACPDGPETLRSGTWSTVRYARSTDHRVFVVMPDGSVTG